MRSFALPLALQRVTAKRRVTPPQVFLTHINTNERAPSQTRFSSGMRRGDFPLDFEARGS